MYSNDNTQKRRAFNVARILIQIDSTESLNQSLKVYIKNVSYSIKIVEDWCGSLQWSKPDTKEYHSDESTDNESWQAQEKRRDNFEGTDDNEEEDASGDLDAILKGINDELKHRDYDKELNDERINSHCDDLRKSGETTPLSFNCQQNSKELTSTSYVRDTGCRSVFT